MKVLALMSDGYGGRGGIALYNRDLFAALAEMPEIASIDVLQRVQRDAIGARPAAVRVTEGAARGPLAYVAHALRAALARPDVILCGHVNLLPLADALGRLVRRPVVLGVYGIDVWAPSGGRFMRSALRRLRAFYSISEVTRERFAAWAPLAQVPAYLLPNAIDLSAYGEAPRRPDLVARYGLEGRRVVLTLGRLSAQERYKGFDEVMESVARLKDRHPDLAYVIAGEGDDRARLEAKAAELGLADRVVFTGYLDEREKADHYRLADVFAMPSSGEGFGFVFLEALACGVPCVGGAFDGCREALRDGLLGNLVDPSDGAALDAAIEASLEAPRGIPEGLSYFAFPEFARRAQTMMRAVLRPSARPAQPAVSA